MGVKVCNCSSQNACRPLRRTSRAHLRKSRCWFDTKNNCTLLCYTRSTGRCSKNNKYFTDSKKSRATTAQLRIGCSANCGVNFVAAFGTSAARRHAAVRRPVSRTRVSAGCGRHAHGRTYRPHQTCGKRDRGRSLFGRSARANTARTNHDLAGLGGSRARLLGTALCARVRQRPRRGTVRKRTGTRRRIVMGAAIYTRTSDSWNCYFCFRDFSARSSDSGRYENAFVRTRACLNRCTIYAARVCRSRVALRRYDLGAGDPRTRYYCLHTFYDP